MSSSGSSGRCTQPLKHDRGEHRKKVRKKYDQTINNNSIAQPVSTDSNIDSGVLSLTSYSPISYLHDGTTDDLHLNMTHPADSTSEESHSDTAQAGFVGSISAEETDVECDDVSVDGGGPPAEPDDHTNAAALNHLRPMRTQSVYFEKHEVASWPNEQILRHALPATVFTPHPQRSSQCTWTGSFEQCDQRACSKHSKGYCGDHFCDLVRNGFILVAREPQQPVQMNRLRPGSRSESSGSQGTFNVSNLSGEHRAEHSSRHQLRNSRGASAMTSRRTSTPSRRNSSSRWTSRKPALPASQTESENDLIESGEEQNIVGNQQGRTSRAYEGRTGSATPARIWDVASHSWQPVVTGLSPRRPKATQYVPEPIVTVPSPRRLMCASPAGCTNSPLPNGRLCHDCTRLLTRKKASRKTRVKHDVEVDDTQRTAAFQHDISDESRARYERQGAIPRPTGRTFDTPLHHATLPSAVERDVVTPSRHEPSDDVNNLDLDLLSLDYIPERYEACDAQRQARTEDWVSTTPASDHGRIKSDFSSSPPGSEMQVRAGTGSVCVDEPEHEEQSLQGFYQALFDGACTGRNPCRKHGCANRANPQHRGLCNSCHAVSRNQ